MGNALGHAKLQLVIIPPCILPFVLRQAHSLVAVSLFHLIRFEISVSASLINRFIGCPLTIHEAKYDGAVGMEGRILKVCLFNEFKYM